jgi:hypothetical protein
MIKGHRLENKSIRDMTRTQILAYVSAYKIEADENKKASRKGSRKW